MKKRLGKKEHRNLASMGIARGCGCISACQWGVQEFQTMTIIMMWP